MTPSGSEHICVVIGRTRHQMVQIEIQEAARRGARMIELRLDFLAKAPDFKRLLKNKPCAMIATVRRPEDGGRWAGTEHERQMLLRQAIVGGFDWVDLETDIANDIRRFKNVKRIVSYHNLREVPANLEKIHAHMCGQDADVVKVAVRAQQPADNLRLLQIVKKAPVPTVALCMGDLGMPSRILGARHGMPFTYAAFNKERGIAPGIPSFEELRKVYFYDRIDSATEVFAVIGDPVAHSLSPLIHNTAFRSLGINAVYIPIRVPRGDLGQFLRQFDAIPVRGYSVTIPHKEAAVGVARDKHAEVDWVQAANTLIRRGDSFSAYNTDYQAALDSLKANLPATSEGEAYPLHSRTVLLLGAGGVAHAVAHALQHAGALVTITNRTPERALQLKEEVGCRVCDWEARNSVMCDMLINCTSVGMQPNVDDMPIHPSVLKPGLVVFDTVYTPETTLLIREARSRGCHVITGVDMFVRQAALQFRLFTGKEPPFELMHSVVHRALSPVAIRDEDDKVTR
jgi:3-dehydroquinate dehydratase/shikimate dehydrogenase